MKVKNISKSKLEVAGRRLCVGHILELKEGEDVSEYIKKGLLKEVD